MTAYRRLISHKLCTIQSRDCHKQISLHLTDEILCRGPGAGARHFYQSRSRGRETVTGKCDTDVRGQAGSEDKLLLTIARLESLYENHLSLSRIGFLREPMF